MQILTENDKKAYKEFLENNERCNFQQSIEWGKVKQAWKNEIVLSNTSLKTYLALGSLYSGNSEIYVLLLFL